MNLNELRSDDDIIKSLKEKYTPDELEKLLKWYNAFDDSLTESEDELANVEEKVWDRLQSYNDDLNKENEYEEPQEFMIPWKSWSLIGLAATILLVAGLWFLGEKNEIHSKNEIVTLQEVAPAEQVQWTTFKNTEKSIYELALPDGSKVWLNPATTISYKITKNAPTRDIYLDGEAFFDVKPNKDQPFHVKNKGLNVVVLGTSFNVVASAQKDKYEVSVVTGKVRVNYQDPNHSDRVNQVIITPQQQVVIKKEENTVVTHDFAVEKVVHHQLWEPITIDFDEVSLDKVLSKLEVEYGVTIRTPNATIRKCTLFANFNNQRLPVMLDIICSSLGANYQIDGNEITIMGEGCM